MRKVTLGDWPQYSPETLSRKHHCFLAFTEYNTLIHIAYINRHEIWCPTLSFANVTLFPGSEALFSYTSSCSFFFQQQTLEFAWFPGQFFTKEWNYLPFKSNYKCFYEQNSWAFSEMLRRLGVHGKPSLLFHLYSCTGPLVVQAIQICARKVTKYPRAHWVTHKEWS